MKTKISCQFITCSLLALLTFTVSASAQIFSSLYSFNEADFANVYGNATISDGVLYGTTEYGGDIGFGSVYKVYLDGSGFQTLFQFAHTNGDSPIAGVVVSGSNIYGTTLYGGTGLGGVIFSMNTDGTGYKVLKNFSTSSSDSDGGYLFAGLVLTNGILYGACLGGGSGYGLVFSINTNGTGYTPVKKFGGNDGSGPMATLCLVGNTLFGTTSTSPYSTIFGTVFKVNTDGGSFQTLHYFGRNDGANPYSSVIVSSNVVYGTTRAGGSFGEGTVFRVNNDGSSFTNLHNFTFSGGTTPDGGLAMISNMLYGTTISGGPDYDGTIFEVSTDGTYFQDLHDFNGADGAYPYASLTAYTNVLYGTTQQGGSGTGGTVFRMIPNGEVPSVTPITTHPVSNGKIQLDYTGAPGTNYVLDAAYNLTSPVAWTPIATNLAAGDGSIHFTNTVNSTNTYWRIRSSP